MQKHNNKPLSYLEDVLKETLKKSKFDTTKYLTYEKSLEAVKAMFEYISFEILQDEVYAVELPKLGIIYKNLHLLRNKTKDEEGKVNEQIKRLQYFSDENGIDSFHNRAPYTWSWDNTIKSKFEVNSNTKRMSKINLEIIAATEKLQNK